MPRLVRRRPLLERIKAYLNPLDFLLWLSEELETRDWDNKTAVTPFALSFHFVFLIARANSASSATKDDDVFGDPNSGTGWLTYFANITVFFLTFLSVGNAAYTFLRKRHYRLFESNIETPQSTPSAHRVKVDSSPVSSSPLRFMQNILGDTSAESRAHPDPTRDVWELAVWDPIPVCLRLFCLFSPGHVLVYWLFLPTQSSDPHPSLAVFRTIFLQALLTAQLLLLQMNFSQQTKDTSVIHKEVLSEYDIKYVHPRLNPLVRDVGTQFSEPTTESDGECEIDTYTPTIVLKRTFQTNPNPNYAKHIDPENTGAVHQRIYTPSPPFTTPSTTGFQPPPVKTPNTAIRQPQFRKSVNTAVSTGTSTSASTGDGGSLGIYSHANSPLKKHSSMYDLNRQPAPRNSFAMAAREISEDRERSRSRSPAKRESSIHRSLYRKEPQHPESAERRSSTPTGFSNARIQGAERGPSRW